MSDFGVVRVGIDAPKHIKIVRDELLEPAEQKNKQKIKSILIHDGASCENVRS